MTGSVPAYDRIDVRRAETLQGLAFAEPVTVWRKHEAGPMSYHIWAPEIHFVDGTWVILFAAGRADEVFAIRMDALSTDAANPLEAEWVERGQVTTDWDSFSLGGAELPVAVTIYRNRPALPCLPRFERSALPLGL